MRLTAKSGTWGLGPVAWASLVFLLLGQFPVVARQANPQLNRIDELVREAMAAKLTPGAVVVVGRGPSTSLGASDQTVYEKAFGFRATVPAEDRKSVV